MGNRALKFCKPNIQGSQGQNTTILGLTLQTTLYEGGNGTVLCMFYIISEWLKSSSVLPDTSGQDIRAVTLKSNAIAEKVKTNHEQLFG
jgi:hypothetical protein